VDLTTDESDAPTFGDFLRIAQRDYQRIDLLGYLHFLLDQVEQFPEQPRQAAKRLGNCGGGIVKPGGHLWLKLFAFFVVTFASSSFAAVLAGTAQSSICSEELALLGKPRLLGASYPSTSQAVTGSKLSTTCRPVKWMADAPQLKRRGHTLKDVVAKGIGSGIKPSAPSAWQISNQVALNTWLYFHRSPNSDCLDDRYASYGANSSNEVSCDWRLQLRL
jgi:hypothetical protein